MPNFIWPGREAGNQFGVAKTQLLLASCTIILLMVAYTIPAPNRLKISINCGVILHYIYSTVEYQLSDPHWSAIFQKMFR